MHVVQGNCSTPPPPLSSFGISGPAFQWQAPQCVVVSDHGSLNVQTATWLDALYIRAKPSPVSIYLALTVSAGAVVYGSRLTLQGDGHWNTSSVMVTGGSRAYVEGAGRGRACMNRCCLCETVERVRCSSLNRLTHM